MRFSRGSTRPCSRRATSRSPTHGAVGDGEKDCTAAFRSAIAACAAAGGGRVVVPAGRFLTGADPPQERRQPARVRGRDARVQPRPAPLPARRLHALGRRRADELLAVHLRVRAARTSRSPARARSTARPSRDALVALEGQRGPPAGATQNGGARAADRHGRAGRAGGRARLRRRARTCGRTSSSRTAARTCSSRASRSSTRRCGRSTRCSARTSPCATSSINSHGPNNDGCDPESCRDVLIEGCTFDTGDDCIALKSGRNDDGRRAERADRERHRPQLHR